MPASQLTRDVLFERFDEWETERNKPAEDVRQREENQSSNSIRVDDEDIVAHSSVGGCFVENV